MHISKKTKSVSFKHDKQFRCKFRKNCHCRSPIETGLYGLVAKAQIPLKSPKNGPYHRLGSVLSARYQGVVETVGGHLGVTWPKACRRSMRGQAPRPGPARYPLSGTGNAFLITRRLTLLCDWN